MNNNEPRHARVVTITKVLVRSLVLAFVLLSMPCNIGNCTNPYINVPEQQRLSREAWQHYWNSLTPRQQYLVKAIQRVEERYYQRYAQHIPLNGNNLHQLMQAVGAKEHEKNFVAHRMQVYLKFDDSMQNADKLINDIMNDPRIWR